MKKSKAINFLLLIVFCSFCFIFQAQAADTNYYVSNSGNDNADGLTPSTSWATVSKVNGSSFSPGDSILFMRGDIWSEQLLIPGSGSANGGYITFGAYGTGNKPVFDGTGVTLPTNFGLIRGSTKNYIIIENIRVQDVGIENSARNENTGIGFYGSDHVIVQDCEVNHIESAGIKMNICTNITAARNDVSLTNVNSSSEQISFSGVNTFEIKYNKSYTNANNSVGSAPGGAGIDVKSGSKNGSIHHNEVWDIGGGNNGIYVDAFDKDEFNIEVYSNYVHDCNSAGFQIASEHGGDLHNITVHHNIVSNCKRGGFAFHNVWPEEGDVYDIFIYNNTVYQNGTNDDAFKYYGGVRLWDELLQGVTFKNNILSHGYHFQIGVQNISPAVVELAHNVIYGPQGDAGFTHLDGTNTITSDPLYKDAANHDFSLQSSSSAINAGDNSVWIGKPNITDFNGTAITDNNGNIIVPGGTVSCGALEFIDENTSSLLYPAMDKTFALNIQNKNIIFTTDRSGELAFKVFDLNGAMVMNYNAKVKGGDYPIPIQLSAGVYLVRMEFGGQFLVKKFSVVH
jgi:hypothetical protein